MASGFITVENHRSYGNHNKICIFLDHKYKESERYKVKTKAHSSVALRLPVVKYYMRKSE